MESWRKVWREGIAPQLSTHALESLEKALLENDDRLIQGATTTPPPLQCTQQCQLEGACAVTYGVWQGDGMETVGEAEEFFAQACFMADQALGEPAACRWFLNWFDDASRDEMRRQLLPEVRMLLNERMTEEEKNTRPLVPNASAA